MDALEFLKERKRMCNYYSHCKGARLTEANALLTMLSPDEDCKRFAASVEQWSKEHPRKTRQSVFLEQFPNVRFDINGIIDISPCQVDQEQYPLNGKDRCRFQSCFDCRREFWMQEVEE